MMIEKSATDILKILLKDFTGKNTISSLSEKVKIGRSGVWKSLKRLESRELVNLEPLGKGQTSAYEITLNWKNPVLEKVLSTILTEDSLEQKRWVDNFSKLERHASFIILFGSILHSPKDANDIDLIVVVNKGKDFKIIEGMLLDIQQTQIKKIHSINMTKDELKSELKLKNIAYLDALKKGTILFGQDNFIKFISDLK